MKRIAIVLLIVGISACHGWHLRGEKTQLAVNSVYLTGQPGIVHQLIKEQLSRKNVLATLPDNALTLALEKELIRRRTASVKGNGSTKEFELILTIDYQILNANQALRPKTQVRVIRSYIFDENDVASKDKEEMILRKDMQRTAARQILQQLQLLQRQ